MNTTEAAAKLTLAEQRFLASMTESDEAAFLTLSDEEQRQLLDGVKIRLPLPYCQQIPFRKQEEFLLRDELEVFFGGSSGGSKSSALLLAALQYVDIPEYYAIIFRRTFKQLEMPGGLIHRSKQWLMNTDAKWEPSNHKWIFPSGAILQFGFMDREDDKYNYQGSDFTYCAFDELTHFTESQYTYLFSRTRKQKGVHIPVRMRASGNPGGVGHQWVFQRFIEKCGRHIEWNKVYSWDVEEVTEGRKSKWQRAFVPSRLEDNPALDYDEYVKSLSNLDPITRAQLLSGDWYAYAGGRFMEEWFKPTWRYQKELWDKSWLPTYILTTAEGKTVRYQRRDCAHFVICDPAASEKQTADCTAITAFALAPNNEILVLECVCDHFAIHDIPLRISQVCSRWDATWVGIESVAGFRGVVSACDRFNRWERAKRVANGDEPGFIPVCRQLSARIAGRPVHGSAKLSRATPAIIRAQNGQIYLPELASWKTDWISEHVRFTGEDGRADDRVDTTAHCCAEVDRMGSGEMPKWASTEDGSGPTDVEDRFERPRRHAETRNLFGLNGNRRAEGSRRRNLFGLGGH